MKDRAEDMRKRAEAALSPESLEDARKLKAKMMVFGITHHQLAEVIGVHHCSLSRWFNSPVEFIKHKEIIEQAISILIEARKNYAD